MRTNVEAKHDDAFRTVVLFWVVERVDSPKEANLFLERPHLSISASVAYPGLKAAKAFDVDSLVKSTTPPVLINREPVKKHTRLLAMDDLNLHKLTDRLKKKRDREREEEAAAVKKAKGE